jgi:HAD superfamily hydrolase (TIGR01509 family)
MSVSTPAAILLDLDGTALATEPLHITAHRQWQASQGLQPDENGMRANIGRGDREYYRDLLAALGRCDDPEAWMHAKNQVLLQIYTTAPVPHGPGLERLLDRAWQAGVPVMIVTSSHRALADAALRSAGLGRRLPMRLCHEDVQRHKPDPQPYLLASARLGVPPSACLAIEDSPTGLRSASAAGCEAIGIDTGLVPAAALRAAGAVRVVRDLAQAWS